MIKLVASAVLVLIVNVLTSTGRHLLNTSQWRIQTRRLGGGSQIRGRQKVFTCLKYSSFSATIVGYHIKVATFSRPRKWQSFGRIMRFFRESPQFEIAFYH